MNGRSENRKLKAFLFFFAILIQVLSVSPGLAGGGPTRGPGVDIEIVDITSHSNGEIVGFAQQTFTAIVGNPGSDPFPDNVNVTLTLYYPGNETENMTSVHTEIVELGDSLGTAGNQTLVTFLPWLPTQQGFYLVNISADVTDDHPGNNSKQIMIRALSSHLEGVKVSFAPGSPSDMLIKKGDNTKMLENDPYVFKVENTGIFNDTFNITIDSEWIMDGWSNQTDELEPGESQDIRVDVAVPIDVDPFAFDIMIFTATSQRNESVYHSISANTSIPINEGVTVTVISKNPRVGYPGGPPIKFTYMIRNTGDFARKYTLTVSSRPSSWESSLDSNLFETPTIPVDGFIIRDATIRVPPLVFETMDEDRTEEGQTAALILTARSPNGYADSAEGIVDVGLVHTVQMDVTPSNITIPFTEGSKTSPQVLNVTVNIRSINNNKADPGADLDVNITTPEGPSGVRFKPIWYLDYEDNISKTWIAVPPAGSVKLRSGEWSLGQHVKIIVPPFPFQGTAVVTIRSLPQLIAGRQGLTISASEDIHIHVGPYLNHSIRPPETEFYSDIDLSINDDENGNWIEDWREGAPGETLHLPFNVTNYGNGWDRYLIIGDAIPIDPTTLLPDDWVIDHPTTTINLIPYSFDPGMTSHSHLVWVHVMIPKGAPIGETATIKIGATSFLSFDQDPEDPVYQWAEIDIHVLQGFGVDLEPEVNERSAEPDETIIYRLNVTNTGNGVDIVRFRVESPDLKGWTVTFDTDELNLTPLGKKTISIRVTPDSDAVRDEILSLKVRAQSGRSIDAFDEVWVNTTVEYRGGVELELVEGQSLIWRHPGDTATFVIEVLNKGNGNDTFQLQLTPGNDAWNVILDIDGPMSSGSALDIARGGSRIIRVNISLPSLDLIRSEEELYEKGIQALNQVSTILTINPKGYPSIYTGLNLTVGVLQEFKASIIQIPGEISYKQVLVGEKVTFRLLLENRGNGPDGIYADPTSPSNSIRHRSWAQIDEGPFDLRPFSWAYVNLTILPNMLDRPLYHEIVDINVEAMAGDNLVYRKINLSVEVVMARILSETLQVDLGTLDHIMIRLCNMPDPGETPELNFPMQRDYAINSTLDHSGAFSEGWGLPAREVTVTLTSVYQLTDVEIPIIAPGDLISGSDSAFINIDVIGGSNKMESLNYYLRAVYFDVSIDMARTRFQDLFEGKDGKAFITLITTGNRGQETIPITVKMDGEVVGTYDIGPASPQEFNSNLPAGGGTQEIVFNFRFELPRLKWFEKGKEMELEILIDEENIIIENQPQGSYVAESNNIMTSEFTIKNYVPPIAIWVLSLMLLLMMMIAGFIGYFFMKKRDSWFLLPLSIGAAGGFGMMFFVPLEDAVSITIANRIGLSIILIDLLFIIPVMIYFFTRSGDAYILGQINKRRGDTPIDGMESITTIWKPITISLVGGLLMILVPMIFWVIPSELDGGLVEMIEVLTSFESVIPVIVIMVAVPLISLAFQFILLAFKRSSLTRINKTWESLDKLQTEIKGGFQ